MDNNTLPDDDPAIVEYTITDGEWIYRADRFGDWRGTNGDRRTRLKATQLWAKQDVTSGRLQRRSADGWIDTIR